VGAIGKAAAADTCNTRTRLYSVAIFAFIFSDGKARMLRSNRAHLCAVGEGFMTMRFALRLSVLCFAALLGA